MKLALPIAVLLVAGTTAQAAIFFDTPTNAANFDLHDANSLPLDIGTNVSVRYQQVIASSEFLGAMPNGAYISYIDFRTDLVFGNGFNTTLPNIQFDLSTTSRGPDQLSLVFAENVGADNLVVFGAGSLRLHAGVGGEHVEFMLDRPFFYDPRAGNLLLDVRNFGGGVTTFFDAVLLPGDSVSRIYATPVDSSAATHADSLGLVVGFVVTPVPEPSSSALLLLGLVGLWFTNRRRGRHRRTAHRPEDTRNLLLQRAKPCRW